MKFTINLIVALILLSGTCIFAQEDKAVTQEQFAVELVKNMNLQDQLPVAALPSDCVALLESIGISPLNGWNRKALLTEDDYTVIIAKAVGKENLVDQKAALVCHKRIEIIDERWQENPNLTLEELLHNKDIFPNGSPQCPYGLKYQDKNNDHKVDQHYHPVVYFQQ
ncbi:MAG: hypothetical protein FJZ11_04310 [Candidatus Omnitrophica bacterium]|nr:hypothetical protein [Candidatus Omnitrophota bacterium]